MIQNKTTYTLFLDIIVIEIQNTTSILVVGFFSTSIFLRQFLGNVSTTLAMVVVRSDLKKKIKSNKSSVPRNTKTKQNKKI